MNEETKQKITPRQFDTYLSAIENSVGSFLFKNMYADVDGVKKDVTEDGWLSCAFYVSSVLSMFKYIDRIHATVNSTVKDLQSSGWEVIDEPVVGSIIVWKPGIDTNNHSHIGFYVGNKQAISNDSWKKCPHKSDWKFDGKREIDMVLWKSEINNII